MDTSRLIFWNVDTQYDFVEPDGKLYVTGAELLKPTWQKLTDLAKSKNIRVINTADYHLENSAELSKNADYMTTFPEHCMAGTKGAEYVKETKPEDAIVFDWKKEYDLSSPLLNFDAYRNIVIQKDAFDVFAGSPWTETILKTVNPEIVVVYGVTTNVCVDFAVQGLAKRVKKVMVVEDAIKELPNIPLPLNNWKKQGVEFLTYPELEKLLG